MKLRTGLLVVCISALTFFSVNAQQNNNSKTAPTAEESKAFLEANGKLKGVVTTPSGLQYKVVKKGKGDKPTAEDRVSLFYTLSLSNGKLLSDDFKNTMWDHHVDKALPGMQEAIYGMQPGEKRILYIPSELAFGNSGEMVPEGSTILCDIELLKAYK